jgi:hypothetical protein
MATELKPVLLSTKEGLLSPVEVSYISEHIGGSPIKGIWADDGKSLHIARADGSTSYWGDHISHQMELYFPDALTSLPDGYGRYCWTNAGTKAKWNISVPIKICWSGNYTACSNPDDLSCVKAIQSDLGEFGKPMTGDNTSASPPEWAIARSHFGYLADGDWATGAGAGFIQTWGSYDSDDRTRNFRNYKAYSGLSGKNPIYYRLRPAGMTYLPDGFSRPDKNLRRWASDDTLKNVVGVNSVPSSFDSPYYYYPTPSTGKKSLMELKRAQVNIPISTDTIISLKAPVMDMFTDKQGIPFVSWIGLSPRKKDSITRRDDFMAQFWSPNTGTFDFQKDGIYKLNTGSGFCIPLDIVHTYISNDLQSACFDNEGIYTATPYPKESGFWKFLKKALAVVAIAIPVVGWIGGAAALGALASVPVVGTAVTAVSGVGTAIGALGTSIGLSAGTVSALGAISTTLNVASGVANIAGARGLAKGLGVAGGITGLGSGLGTLGQITAAEGAAGLASFAGVRAVTNIGSSIATISGDRGLASAMSIAGNVTNLASGVLDIAGSNQMPSVGLITRVVASGASLGGNTDIANIARAVGAVSGVATSKQPITLSNAATLLRVATPYVAPKPEQRPPIKVMPLPKTVSKTAPVQTFKTSSGTITLKRVKKPL